MKTIHLKTDGYTYWAEKYSRSELLLTHINHGERKFYLNALGDIVELAGLHDWRLEIKEFEKDE